jgi:hypothetical protein
VTAASGRVRRIAAWLGLTEGQAYTVVLLALVAALLSSSLTGLTGRIDDVLAAPRPVPTTIAPTDTTAPPTTVFDLPLGGPTGTFPFPTTSTTATSIEPGAPGEDPEAEPPAAVCAADPLIKLVGDTVRTLDVLTGNLVPDGTIVSALAVATGCSRLDPAILLLAGLIEIGQGLPDLGLGGLELPALPFLTLPQPILDLVQPLRAVLDPICGTVASLTVITSQVGPSYPPPLDAVFAVSLFYALTTCGQIQA